MAAGSSERDYNRTSVSPEDLEKDPGADNIWKTDNTDKLVSELQDSVDVFQTFTRTSSYFEWARKTWTMYYHLAFQEGDHYQVGLVSLGDQGELVGAQLNHLRNLIQHRLNLVTKDRPALIGRARNSDLKSIKQAELGTSLLEYYLNEKKVETHLIRAVEDALIFAEGFVVQTWNPAAGRTVDAVEETDEFEFEGDLEYHNPVNWNVIRDLGVRQWKDHKWLGVRSGKNKWDLVAEFPEHAEKIKGAERWLDVPLDEGGRPFDEDKYFTKTDQVIVLEFWHKRCLALPEGRYLMICNGEVLIDTPMPYRELPVHRVTPSEITLTPFGYSPAFDIVPIQELINMAASIISSNQNAFGTQSIWIKSGGGIRPNQMMGGMNIIESEEPPQAVQLTATPGEVFSWLDSLVRHGELVAGIDQVTRGYTDDNVRSGAFAALLQSQSVSFSSGLTRQYHQLLESVGTAMLRMLRDFADEERVITIMGKHNKPYIKYFSGDDLILIDRVTVESTNPAFNTFAGKMEMAKMFMETGMIKTPEQVLSVFQSGNIDSLLEADNAQLAAMREENEMLLEGQEVPEALMEDNHVMHIREHMAILSTIETRQSMEIRGAVQAHVMGHLQYILGGDPNAQMLQTILGYEVPFPPGAMPDGAGMPTAPPPGNQGQAAPAPELTAAPNPQDANLDRRSQAQLPEPSQAPPQ
jgi:hypothetical protein